jgi:hypothetical protein
MQVQGDNVQLGVLAFVIVGSTGAVVAGSGPVVTRVGTGQYMVTLPGGTTPGGTVVPGPVLGATPTVGCVQVRTGNSGASVYVDSDPYNKLVFLYDTGGSLANYDFSLLIMRPTAPPT